jgi:hypothetical protein
VPRRTTPAAAIACTTVLIVLVVMVTFSIYGGGSSGGCAADAANVRRGVATFRARHGAHAVPTMSELAATGAVLQPSVLHDLSYAGSPPKPHLTPRPGSGC